MIHWIDYVGVLGRKVGDKTEKTGSGRGMVQEIKKERIIDV